MRGKGEGSKPFKDKNGLWTARIELPSAGGSRRQKKFRSKDYQEVIRKRDEALAALRVRGDLPTADQTVKQWFDYWLVDVAKNVRPNTASNYRTVAEKYILPTIGSVKLEKLSAAHVRKVTNRMTDELGLSSTYALNAHRIMSASFEMCMREGRISRNPAKMTGAPRKNVTRLEVLTPAETIQVLAHVKDIPNGARWATALLTGARRGEALGLELDRVGDVLDLSWQLQRMLWRHGCDGKCNGSRGADCPSRRISVPADYEYRRLLDGLYLTRPKSRSGWRIIPLVDPLRSILERHIAEQEPNPWGLLFTHKDRPIDPDQDSRNWRRVLAQTGIEKNVRLHDLRHGAVDMMITAGVPMHIITEIMGHSSWASTQAYKSRGNLPVLMSGMMMMSQQLTRHDLPALDA